MKPIVLAILDGVGLADESLGNAFSRAEKPNIDYLFKRFDFTTLKASGQRVGLPKNQMGNSEVGHLNIGAGRVVYQALELINNSIANDELKNRDVIQKAIEHAKNNNSKVHVMGLLSDGGVHSHINHYKEIIKLIDDANLEVVSHAILDGRDVGPKTALLYIEELKSLTDDLNNGHLATVGGRFYAMDRDKRYERTQKAYSAIVNAEAKVFASASVGVEASYAEDVLDEFVVPFVINGYEGVNDNDVFIFVNFRPDRAIQISNAIIDSDFAGFARKVKDNLYYVSMTKYTGVNSEVIFENEKIKNGLGEFLANNGYKQLRIAETEKYAHVTFFFDGGEEKDYPGLKKVLVPSPKVTTYDLKPEMSACEVTNNLLMELDEDVDVVILNYANPDMVGHTGNIEATICAVEKVDECLGMVYRKVSKLGGTMIITADHGNSEMLLDDAGNVVTAHTTNEVPFIITNESIKLKSNMSLCDIAPTIIELLDEKKPVEMSGESIIKEK